jgi:hypothetical protein
MQDSNLGRRNRNKPTETFKFSKTASCCDAIVEGRISLAKFDGGFVCLRSKENRNRIRGFARSLRSSKFNSLMQNCVLTNSDALRCTYA